MNKTGCLFVLLSATLPLHAQNVKDQDLVDAYLAEAKDHAELYYSPIENIQSSAFWINHPYWQTDDLSAGEICYNGMLYKNQVMRINIATQNLVVATPKAKILVVPDITKIDYFILFAKRFEYIDGKIQCIEWSNGQIRLLHEKTKKKGSDVVKDGRSYYSYDESDKFTLVDGKSSYKVKKANDIIKLYPQYKKQIKKALAQERQNEMSKKDRLQKMIVVLNTVSTLK